MYGDARERGPDNQERWAYLAVTDQVPPVLRYAGLRISFSAAVLPSSLNSLVLNTIISPRSPPLCSCPEQGGAGGEMHWPDVVFPLGSWKPKNSTFSDSSSLSPNASPVYMQRNPSSAPGSFTLPRHGGSGSTDAF